MPYEATNLGSGMIKITTTNADGSGYTSPPVLKAQKLAVLQLQLTDRTSQYDAEIADIQAQIDAINALDQ